MRRRAFTLTELLIVIVIIGMLASMSLGALYAARESAREAATKATITKIDRIIQAEFEELLTRRVPIDTSRVTGKNYAATMLPATQANFTKQAFLVKRWIAKAELPDRLSDVAIPDNTADPWFSPGDLDEKEIVFVVTGPGIAVNPSTGIPMQVTDTWEVSMQRTAQAKRLFRNAATMSSDNDCAEMLYAIVWSDIEARDKFQGNEIGDVDGDGANEFHDAWGNPIKWLRWPTGYVTESQVMTGDPEHDHDPFDTHRKDPVAFRTVPLIWSNGPDGKSGLDLTTYDFAADAIYTHQYGKPVDSSHEEYNAQFDNITNHAIGMN